MRREQPGEEPPGSSSGNLRYVQRKIRAHSLEAKATFERRDGIHTIEAATITELPTREERADGGCRSQQQDPVSSERVSSPPA